MAEFIINQEVKTETPTVEVTLSADSALPLGRHTFRLVVVDDSGNSSIADDVIVIVADTENPTAVLNAPRSVDFATSFNLDGSRSFDAGGGRVVTYLWTYMGQP
ncbi:hypothetical protein E4Q23_17735 [Candidatus Accumulibacter phosphatis]|jgi:hypothetical protein|uniref:PKD domain-containing protein n=1 Tax=Candidatus Accumulibacter phosphatis TaxID=327160 RepID=A0ABX1TYT7_9PROT|nr:MULTISPECIES: hypothetical protein [Candidatus Accumulibacter]NMQ29444.1 hypothetical protein [Candidatus Accumulibacter phosphatis]